VSDPEANAPESPELAGGNYEVIRKRLEDQAQLLADAATALNETRKEIFGGQELVVIGNEKVRTENNCVPRNIVNVGGRLLFAYNVFIGLKKAVRVEDVFAVHRFAQTEEGFDLSHLGLEEDDSGILHDKRFEDDFKELYQYYSNARLLLARTAGAKLLAVFQIGDRDDDIRVFRWALNQDGTATYIDNRGERDHVYPPSHDFEWTKTTIDDHIKGRHPHISILDEVFVETVGGDLTIKVEDNTESGHGIYSEPVADPHQSLDDAETAYAKLGSLILLRVRPFGEETTRYLVFNTRTQQVIRNDNIGQACVQLPEDHGIIFPGGYVLHNGAHKSFDAAPEGLIFKRAIRSPNGEDVLYVFHKEDEGTYVLLPYNLIRQEVQNPIHGHGYTLFADGRMVVFKAESDQPTRVHPMQVWQTPFVSDEVAAAAPTDGSYLAKVGNPELVRGISDMLAIRRALANLTPSQQVYEDLIAACTRARDAYHWLDRDESGQMGVLLDGVRTNAELIIDEFLKVQALKKAAAEAIVDAETRQDKIFDGLRVSDFVRVQDFMDALTNLRTQRGHLITMQEIRYIDRARIDELEADVIARFDETSEGVVQFLLGDDALKPVVDELEATHAAIGEVTRASDMVPVAEQLGQTGAGLELLIEIVGGLEVGDPTDRTRILESISEIFGQLNRVRAVLEGRRKELLASEGRAEFSAQFKLLGQGVSSNLALADTPEKCEEQLSRLMLQLEELEGRFGEFDEFLGDLTTKREEIYEAFESKRQALLDERQRRAGNLADAAKRIIDAVGRRAKTFKETDQLNAYFAADAMVLKLRKISEQLSELGDSVKSEEVLGQLKRARQDALRGLRDRQELFDDGDGTGGPLIKFGRHRFSVNTQALELTMVPRGEDMALHLTGTDFYELIEDEAFAQTRSYWAQTVVSETAEVYRGEFLAMTILRAAEQHTHGLTLQKLQTTDTDLEALTTLVRDFASDRYDEGYERGVHDHDAALILDKILSLRQSAGRLRFAPTARALAVLFWALEDDQDAKTRWHRQAWSLGRMAATLPNPPALAAFCGALADRIGAALSDWAPLLPEGALSASTLRLAGAYLAEELSAERPRFVASAAAVSLQEGLLAHLDRHGGRRNFDDDLRGLDDHPQERFRVGRAWIEAFRAHAEDERLRALGHVDLEAAVLLCTQGLVDSDTSSAVTEVDVTGLLGNHPLIKKGVLHVRLDAFLDRVGTYLDVNVPGYTDYRVKRHELLESQRHRLRLEEYMPKVMSAFVRNKLINDVYLPIIGDNLAKQMGAAGAGKRTDNMGMLLLISPPGYGKTTLMEYVANRLGLIFMKVNGPALGHEVTSLDPEEAPNATARQEVEKLNLALEMGNNVMLYLDDIQHTHPEFLQKFISLCDGTRRIEGVWKGRTRTYDLRGKQFCVVMAGNPYTEAGTRFQIPDMLSNRADVYNLGDILGGREDVFALSYVENSLTSNAVLAPLATRPQSDVYLLARRARGEEIDTTELSHDYTQGELSEIDRVLRHLFVCRDTLLKVNQLYITSAATEDAYRTEPPFKLQGSYRNMNKLAEKVVAAMNDDELEQLIADHYLGEAQTLTTGAEQNLLKLGELRDTLTDEQAARWEEIKKGFTRNLRMGGKEDDPVMRVTGTLASLVEQVEGVQAALGAPSSLQDDLARIGDALGSLQGAVSADRVSAPLGSLAQQVGTIAQALEGGVRDDQLPAALEALGETLVDVQKRSVKYQTEANRRALTESAQLQAEALAQALSAAAAASSAGEAPPAAAGPTATATGAGLDLTAGGWLLPNLELSTEADVILRHAILLEVQRALVTQHRMQAGGHKQLSTSQLVLSGALPVMQHLAAHIQALSVRYLPPASREQFLDELRRTVASAIAELSEVTGENIEPVRIEDPMLEEDTADVEPSSP